MFSQAEAFVANNQTTVVNKYIHVAKQPVLSIISPIKGAHQHWDVLSQFVHQVKWITSTMSSSESEFYGFSDEEVPAVVKIVYSQKNKEMLCVDGYLYNSLKKV